MCKRWNIDPSWSEKRDFPLCGVPIKKKKKKKKKTKYLSVIFNAHMAMKVNDNHLFLLRTKSWKIGGSKSM